jgi:hypothetical protein
VYARSGVYVARGDDIGISVKLKKPLQRKVRWGITGRRALVQSKATARHLLPLLGRVEDLVPPFGSSFLDSNMVFVFI